MGFGILCRWPLKSSLFEVYPLVCTQDKRVFCNRQHSGTKKFCAIVIIFQLPLNEICSVFPETFEIQKLVKLKLKAEMRMIKFVLLVLNEYILLEKSFYTYHFVRIQITYTVEKDVSGFGIEVSSKILTCDSCSLVFC